MASASAPRPDRPRQPLGGRPHVGALRRALESAARALVDPERGEAATESVHRIARAVAERSAVEGRPEMLAAATTVLEAQGPRLQPVTGELIALLRRADRIAAAPEGDLILIVEDDPQFARFLEAAIGTENRRVVIAETAAEARAAIALETPSLLILDLILPDSDGRNLLLELRSSARTAAVPVVVVTARLGGEVKAECFALGADAYFEKPLEPESFAVAVASQLERQARYTQLCRRDPVTGLPNRAAFLETCTHLLATNPPGSPMALAVLDLDHFQYVEARWGRVLAETVLRGVGTRLALALRPATSFARWDGAQFIALYSGQGAVEAALTFAQALEMIRRLDIKGGDGQPIVVTFSAGIADVLAGQPFEEALTAADRLLYAAKITGQNRILTSDTTIAVPAQRILLAEDDPSMVRILSRHLQQEGFQVVSYTNGREALEAAPTSGAALIISDIEMPELDGLAFLEALRAHPALQHVPVMMLTARGEESVIVRAFELGADEYVTKPFSPRELSARVRRLLRRPAVMGIPASP